MITEFVCEGRIEEGRVVMQIGRKGLFYGGENLRGKYCATGT